MYESKAKTTKITFTSRVAIKLKDNYYTVEASEERSIPEDADVMQEWKLLCDDLNSIVDDQQAQIVQNFK